MADLYVCGECDAEYTSMAALRRCDCGSDYLHDSPSRQRLSYDLGYD